MALAGSVCLLAAIVMHLLTAAAGVVSMLLRLGTGWTWWRHRPATVKVYRFLRELAAEDTEVVVLCEGDMTFRARDLISGRAPYRRSPAC
jgi:glycosylphosphatidylinositol transamidase (GPIT) subunit GPI8